VLVASLTLWFATFYLLMEVVIHCLTNFNYIPQTGLVLPWVSSGGSAAIAFSGLLALVLAMAAQVYKRIAARERGQRHA
jgi:cell division protein FtsW (lipid II flippase)